MQQVQRAAGRGANLCHSGGALSNSVWVGFIRIRKSALMHGLGWSKHGFRQFESPTHISLYDIRRHKLLQQIDLDPYGINIPFGIHSWSP